jgi:stress-induced morphogen
MSSKSHEKTDRDVAQVKTVLKKYESQHSAADVAVRRQNSVSIRVRIVDPDFAGVSRTERHEAVWRVLDELPEKIQSQLTMLLLLTPDEKNSSLANLEFEDPIPSKL